MSETVVALRASTSWRPARPGGSTWPATGSPWCASATTFHAVDDECSHEDYSLSEGEVWVDECEIECPRHGSTFDLLTGEPCSLPATQPGRRLRRWRSTAAPCRWCSRDAPSTSSRSRACTRRPAGARCCTASTSTVRSGEVHVDHGAERLGQEHPGPRPHGSPRHRGHLGLASPWTAWSWSDLPAWRAGPCRPVPGPAAPGGGARAWACEPLLAAASGERRRRGRRSTDRMVERGQGGRTRPRAFCDRPLNVDLSGGERSGPRWSSSACSARRSASSTRSTRGSTSTRWVRWPDGCSRPRPNGASACSPSRTSTASWSQLEADMVHVLVDGRIVATGDAELALQLERTGTPATRTPLGAERPDADRRHGAASPAHRLPPPARRAGLVP